MVQIKPPPPFEEGLMPKSFISHMVQIKLAEGVTEAFNHPALYPTWFR
ncbi:MAG: hypothetical protein N2257_10900 [Thermodesulfovibrionales bacterium]|nr:hypothetical protein [Thermodesulfovibrionales bacterium]